MSNIALRPYYCACVSGGKDSLFMLKLILSNPEKYPLNAVIHFELEVDYPFVKNVIDYMESECNKYNIDFIRIKPKQTWEELYFRFGFPTRINRWCNSRYKLSCKEQFQRFLISKGYYLVSYIGYCYDEKKRYEKRNALINEVYPLVDFCINEDYILRWARYNPIFNNYYLTNKRCGCMYCPMSSFISFAYLYKYYPEHFNYMILKMRETEQHLTKSLGKNFSVISSNSKYDSYYLEDIVKTKYLKKLNSLEEYYKKYKQLEFLIEGEV